MKQPVDATPMTNHEYQRKHEGTEPHGPTVDGYVVRDYPNAGDVTWIAAHVFDHTFTVKTT